MNVPPLCPVSPFAGLPATTGGADGLIATERDGLGIACLTARNGQTAALERLFHARFGIDLPGGPRRVCGHGVAAAGIAPESWLITCEDAADACAQSLRSALGGRGSVVDLSDAYAMLRLSGPKVRDSLARLVPLDLHERRFAPGAVAQTVVAHMSVTLWRLEEAERAAPVFEICVARSLAHSLYGVIRDSALEFGFGFEPAPHAPLA